MFVLNVLFGGHDLELGGFPGKAGYLLVQTLGIPEVLNPVRPWGLALWNVPGDGHLTLPQ